MYPWHLIHSNYGWYLYNAHGDVVQLTDSSGAVTKSYDYDPYGVALMDDDPGDANPYRYCGEYTDQESGYVYLRARYYDPSIGRFISVDAATDGHNWYSYCAGNPVNRWDPSGHSWKDFLTGIGRAIDDNIFFGFFGALGGKNAAYGSSKDYYAGRLFGDVASMAVSIGEFMAAPGVLVGSGAVAVAETVFSGGTAAPAAVVTAVGGVVASGAMAVHSIASMYTETGNMISDIFSLYPTKSLALFVSFMFYAPLTFRIKMACAD